MLVEEKLHKMIIKVGARQAQGPQSGGFCAGAIEAQLCCMMAG